MNKPMLNMPLVDDAGHWARRYRLRPGQPITTIKRCGVSRQDPNMTIYSKADRRPPHCMPYGNRLEQPIKSSTAATLPKSELKRIVAAMLG